MRIQNNIMAMNTHRMYTTNNNSVSKAAEKLSSGYRINRAGDDAAGLAISEKMRAQIRGLNMATKNSQDAVSMVQTAEGALQEVHTMLQRMNELSVQAASDSNDSSVDRAALQQEFANLQGEIDQIASTTKFNNMALLDGVNGPAGGTLTPPTVATPTVTLGGIAATTDQPTLTIALAGASMSGPGIVSITMPSTAGNPTVKLSATITESGTTDAAGIVSAFTGQTIELNGKTFTAAAGAGAANTSLVLTSVDARGADTPTLASYNLAGTAGTVTETGSAWTIQVGAEENQTMNIVIGPMNTTGLGVAKGTGEGTANISTRADASSAITSTRTAINKVSTQRAELGALQNRLDHKIANLENTSENLSAAESRIRDVDMAKEMTTFTKQNILSQAATAMLAQANAAPQGVLSLLQ